MDLKALMQKLETINKTEILTESEKKETTWTDKSGKKHPATQVKGDKYTGKEAEKDAKPKKDDLEEHFTSAIARGLVEEFGYELEEENLEEAPVANPYQGADAAKFAAMSPEDQAWLTKGGGVPDINDEFILRRAPNGGKPVTKPAASALPTGMTQADVDQARNAEEEPGTFAQAPAAPAAGAATKPAAVDPAVAATREKFKALMDKLEKTGGVSGSAPAPAAPAKPAAPAPKKPATGAATKPAAPAGNSVDWNAIGAGQMTAESTLADEQTLLAIKNIRY